MLIVFQHYCDIFPAAWLVHHQQCSIQEASFIILLLYTTKGIRQDKKCKEVTLK